MAGGRCGATNVDQIESYLNTLSLDELVDVKKRVETFQSADELKDDIIAHFYGVYDRKHKRRSPLDVEAGVHDEKDIFTDCLVGKATQPQKDDAPTPRSSSCCVPQSGGCCTEVLDEKQVLHPMLPGIQKENDLRSLLGKMPLPKLKKLLARLQEGDDANEVIDDIVDLWKVAIFKKIDDMEDNLQNEDERKKNAANNEYSFIPGDANHSYFAYFSSRWRHSNLHKYVGGFAESLELTPNETDTTVNAIILLDALILTIPFSIIPCLTTAFWDTLKADFRACPSSLYPSGWDADSWFYGWYYKLNNWILATIYIVIGGISLACFYYTNRPLDERKFRIWWVTGKYSFYAIQLLAVTGVIMLLTILSCMMVIFSTPSSLLCSTVANYSTVSVYSMQFNIFGASGIFAIIVGFNFFLTI